MWRNDRLGPGRDGANEARRALAVRTSEGNGTAAAPCSATKSAVAVGTVRGCGAMDEKDDRRRWQTTSQRRNPQKLGDDRPIDPMRVPTSLRKIRPDEFSLRDELEHPRVD
jgi:hypothetical protein